MKLRLGKGALKALVGILALLALALCALLAVRVLERVDGAARTSAAMGGDAADDREEGRVYYREGWYTQKKGLETVLVLGIDKYAQDQGKAAHGNYEQADFLMLLALDREAGTCTGIHLNRDTMTKINVLSDAGAVAGTKTGQLTLAHTYGGTARIRCRNTVTAVSDLLYGIEIDHYLSLSMDGVAVLNDLAGGVTLEALDDFPGEPGIKKGETVTLRGDQALAYVRTRKGLEDSSNLRRMERQRQYLEALQEKLFQKIDGDEGFLSSALLEVNPYLVSDCTVEQLSGLVEDVKDCGSREYITLVGTARKGETYMEFYPDEEALQELVVGLFFEQAEGEN